MTLERIEAVARWGPPINGIWITLAVYCVYTLRASYLDCCPS
jgi:hypothetical protein